MLKILPLICLEDGRIFCTFVVHYEDAHARPLMQASWLSLNRIFRTQKNIRKARIKNVLLNGGNYSGCQNGNGGRRVGLQVCYILNTNSKK